MKKDSFLKRSAVGMLVAAAVVTVPSLVPAQAGEGAEVRDINLNIDGRIAGIEDPTSTGTGASSWGGDCVYFGNYNDSTITWRVLDANTSGIFNEKETMLLLSDSILDKRPFRRDYWAEDSSEWRASDVRTWLADEVLAGFDAGEQAAVALSTKTALAEDETELNDTVFAPLENDRLFLMDAAEVKPAYGYDTSRARGIGGTWWTRSACVSMNNHQGTFCPIGNATVRGGYESQGVVPAFNLDLSRVIFVSKGIAEKASVFAVTEDGTGIGMWNLTLADGEGFQARRKSGERVGEGERVTVEVTSLASGNLHSYTQISAMLVDEYGTVAAYGKVAEKIQTGNVTFRIPGEVPQGRYILKIFEEKVNDISPYMQTDYASNMAEMTLTIVEAGQGETEATEPETDAPEPETKEPETDAPEPETKEPETDAPETETKEPETDAPETETKEPETDAPETETKEPETDAPETGTKEPETKEPETEAKELETNIPEQKETIGNIQEPETSQSQNDLPAVKIKGKRPPRPRITKINRTAKAFRVRWKKLSAKVNGCQIQYSTNMKFKGTKVRTVNVKRAKATQRRVVGLKAGKKYYVRVRTWRNVGGRKYYSLWSRKRAI